MDAQTERPLYQRLLRCGFNGDGRTTVRPLCQRLQRHGFNGDGRSTERPYKSLLVSFAESKRYSPVAYFKSID